MQELHKPRHRDSFLLFSFRLTCCLVYLFLLILQHVNGAPFQKGEKAWLNIRNKAACLTPFRIVNLSQSCVVLFSLQQSLAEAHVRDGREMSL